MVSVRVLMLGRLDPYLTPYTSQLQKVQDLTLEITVPKLFEQVRGNPMYDTSVEKDISFEDAKNHKEK